MFRWTSPSVNRMIMQADEINEMDTELRTETQRITSALRYSARNYTRKELERLYNQEVALNKRRRVLGHFRFFIDDELDRLEAAGEIS